MMAKERFNERLRRTCRERDSLLCLNLDPETARLPAGVARSPLPVWRFVQEVLDATLPALAAVKLNLAFYEVLGKTGWDTIERILAYLPGDVINIADGKRNDIGNSARMYAEAYFSALPFDAVTLNPLLGIDSVAPFTERPDRGAFILALTSNPSADDFEKRRMGRGRLCDEIARKCVEWNTRGNVGLVVGATQGKDIRRMREIAPALPFLIPGIGAQAGDLEQAVRSSHADRRSGTLIAAGRSVLYADSTNDYAAAAGREAARLCADINRVRKSFR
ncbi:MAG: orotidine-5'-phosphate decarboxylase [Ignavibacteriales bacterium CG07_land_8_20_14_0_80_59_12]|nr:MAG: orotidine-5'-phosphate decarboxylase [Ignavibacteriales bacterium CG07_land_8_20_14_0_80_59_12]